MNTSTLRRPGLVALLATSLAMTGCGSSDEPESSTPSEDTATEVITMAIGADEGTLTPYTLVFGYPGRKIVEMLYDSLLRFDENNQTQPSLATDVEVDDSGMVYTATIRDDVTFHDGEPLTAEDVAFTYTYSAMHTTTTWGTADEDLASVEADGNTVTITLNRVDPDFMRRLADVAILPEHIWADIEDPETATDATGSGPYELVEYVPDQLYRLEANEDYPLGTPSVQEIRIPIIAEPATAFAALQTGEIDITSEAVEPQLLDQFENNADLELVSGPSFTPTLLNMNNGRPGLSDPAVRRAIGLAIDVDELIDVVLLGAGLPGNPGFIHPESPLAVSPLEPTYDPEQASQVLDEAGYALGTDGVRTGPDGPMSYELLVYADDPTRIRSAELIAEMLAEVGISVQVTSLDSTTVDEFVWPDFDVASGRDYDLAMWGWSAPVQLEVTRLGALIHSDAAIGSLNVVGYANPEADALVEELRSVIDPAERDDLLVSYQELVAEDRPFVNLFYENRVFAFRPDTYDGYVDQVGQGIVNEMSFVRFDE